MFELFACLVLIEHGYHIVKKVYLHFYNQTLLGMYMLEYN